MKSVLLTLSPFFGGCVWALSPDKIPPSCLKQVWKLQVSHWKGAQTVFLWAHLFSRRSVSRWYCCCCVWVTVSGQAPATTLSYLSATRHVCLCVRDLLKEGSIFLFALTAIISCVNLLSDWLFTLSHILQTKHVCNEKTEKFLMHISLWLIWFYHFNRLQTLSFNLECKPPQIWLFFVSFPQRDKLKICNNLHGSYVKVIIHLKQIS